jgi:glucose 1-dehydrogenase
MRLSGKVALVTGASSGIGKAIALRFADEGADVAVNYHSHPEEANAVVWEIEGKGRRALAVQADVSQFDQIQRMVSQTIEALGRVDLCVNNAGVQREIGFLDVTEDDWKLMIDVDLKGCFFVSQACARDMVQRGKGKILNVSSVHQEIAKPRFAPYCAGKGGIRMLTKTLAMELAEHKINVIGIAPGAIATPMNADVLSDPSAKQSVIQEIPWGRFGTAEEVAGLAAYLASDEADYITGTTVFLDGGLVEQVVEYQEAKS